MTLPDDAIERCASMARSYREAEAAARVDPRYSDDADHARAIADTYDALAAGADPCALLATAGVHAEAIERAISIVASWLPDVDDGGAS